jgi:hypothetical protein
VFRSEFCFRTTQELEVLFFLSLKARICFPEFHKNSESLMLNSGKKILTLVLSEIKILTLVLSEIKILDGTTPPLQVKWSVPY